MPCGLLFIQGEMIWTQSFPQGSSPLRPLLPPLYLPKYIFCAWTPEYQSQRGPEAIVRSREGQVQNLPKLTQLFPRVETKNLLSPRSGFPS